MSLRIATRLQLMAGISFLLFFISMAVGLYGMKSAAGALKTVYEDRAVPLGQIAGIVDVMRENRAEIFRALQHDPQMPGVALHDHPIERHFDALEKRNREAEALWNAYMATYLTDDEKVLAAKAEAARLAWQVRLNETIAALRAGDFGIPVLYAYLNGGRTEGEAAIVAHHNLRDYQLQVAKQEFETAQNRYEQGLLAFALLLVFGVAGQVTTMVLAMRRINGGLQVAGEAARAIAAGDLTRQLPTSGQDEIGELLRHMSTMRDNLSDLVGALYRNVETLNQSAGELTRSAEASQQASETQAENASSRLVRNPV